MIAFWGTHVFAGCVWLGIWASVRVVAPTVPETPSHNPQPRVCRRSDADHILPGIVRRQAAGGLRADTGQAVRMRFGTTSVTGIYASRLKIRD